jgi:hypothetical protein
VILVVTTSSPNLGCAVFSPNGEMLRHAEVVAPQQAAELLMSLVTQVVSAEELKTVTGFVADKGPGGFSGIRIGLTMVKTWGWMFGKPVAGISAFDLFEADSGVWIPVRKGEWVRNDSEGRVVTHEFSGVGYGTGIADPTFPSVRHLRLDFDALNWQDAAELVPEYLAEPSISTPKKAFAVWDGRSS